MAVKTKAAPKAYLSLPQASAHLQITVRKLSYWASVGVIEGKRNGKEHLLGRRALLMARIVDAITQKVSIQALRPHLPTLASFVSTMMWSHSPETYIVVMLSDFAVKRVEQIYDKKKLVELATEGPMFALKVPMAWQRETICLEE